MLKIAAALILGSLLYVTTVQCLSPQHQALKDQIDEKCKNVTGISEESIQQGRSGQYPPDEPYKCFIQCQLKQTMVQVEMLRFDLEGLFESFTPEPEEVVNEKEARCGSLGTDTCDAAYNRYKCFSENSPLIKPLY